MTSGPTRILLVGDDAPSDVAVSATLGDSSSHISVPGGIEADDLDRAAKDVDVIIVLTDAGAEDPAAPLRVVRRLGLQRGTIVIADDADQRTAGEALALGVGGYLTRGGDVGRLANAISEVADRGVFYSGPAADVLHRSLEPDEAPTGEMNAMNAARSLASALELKDTYTGGHADRVAAMAMRLARAAMIEGALPNESLEAAFLLHDVGKIGIPESILRKTSALTDGERQVLQTHPVLGERIVAPLGFPPVVAQVIRHHHERWDGAGYPDGLAGKEIPAAARLFTIADSIDAMTSTRPYRMAMSFETAITEIMEHAGTQFDPDLCVIVGQVFFEGASA